MVAVMPVSAISSVRCLKTGSGWCIYEPVLWRLNGSGSLLFLSFCFLCRLFGIIRMLSDLTELFHKYCFVVLRKNVRERVVKGCMCVDVRFGTCCYWLFILRRGCKWMFCYPLHAPSTHLGMAWCPKCTSFSGSAVDVCHQAIGSLLLHSVSQRGSHGVFVIFFLVLFFQVTFVRPLTVTAPGNICKLINWRINYTKQSALC